MAGKFYYNGELIATSKNRHFKYAVIDETAATARAGKIGCRTEYADCAALIDREVAKANEWRKNMVLAIRALERGAKGCMLSNGNRLFWIAFGSGDTLDKYAAERDRHEERAYHYHTHWKIVALEER